MMLLVGMRAVRLPPRVASAVAIAVLLFYGQLAGGGASVTRARHGGLRVSRGARSLDHRGPALNALAVAAVFAVAVSPLAPFDAGFILSFGATLGILLGTSRLAGSGSAVERADGVRRLRRAAAATAAAALFVATVCAELALAPVGAALFSRITFAGLILNFAAIPLMTVVQAAAMAALAASASAEPVAAAAAGTSTHCAASGLVQSAAARRRRAVARARRRPAGLVARRRLLRVLRGAAGVPAPRASGAVRRRRLGRAHAGGPRSVDVARCRAAARCGSCSSTSARETRRSRSCRTAARSWSTPAGSPGSTFDSASASWLPRCVRSASGGWTRSSSRTAIPITSEVRRPCCGGSAPRTVWEGVPVPPHPGLRALAAAAALVLVWRTVQAGDREVAAGVEIRVLHPPPPDWERQRVRNDDSVVLELRIGDVSIVLPGDIGGEGERHVTPRLVPGPITIVKAPHHGSATSSTRPFITAAHPAAVIFSAGRDNRFGHPAPAVVARYRAAGAAIFRTDEDGAVVVETDGKRAEITTWSGRRIDAVRSEPKFRRTLTF